VAALIRRWGKTGSLAIAPTGNAPEPTPEELALLDAAVRDDS
jgi:hypothetical protein